MSAPTTATVETLTAEVRVLKVGNRQITLGVAKQLDVIPIDRLQAFGRIQLGSASRRAERPTHPVDVIGADIETGVLCRSLVYYDHRGCTVDQHKAAQMLPLIVLAGLR